MADFRYCAPELRAALGDKGGNSLLRIVGAAGGDDRFLFGVKLIRKTGLKGLTQHAANGAVGARRTGGERGGERGSLGLHRIARSQTRHQAEFEGFLRVQAAIEQEQLLCLPHPHHARKKPGVAAIRRQAQRAVAERKPRIISRDNDIGGIQ